MNKDVLGPSLIAETQASLSYEKKYGLYALAENLGLVDCFQRPELLRRGKLVFESVLNKYFERCSLWIRSLPISNIQQPTNSPNTLKNPSVFAILAV